MATESYKYVYMENVLQQVNSNFVSLSKETIKLHNIYLTAVIKTVIDKMKETNSLFNKLYSNVFYGGSYYDDLKISKPEEYDLDLLLKLPKYAEPKMTKSDLPGFVNVQLSELEKFKNQPEYISYYSDLPKILDENHYLDGDNVKTWMESVISKTLNKFEKSGDQSKITCELANSDTKTFLIKLVKSGPAFTLQIIETDTNMDVDLVPCFVFQDEWPSNCGFKKNPFPKLPQYFIVPKIPHSMPKDGFKARCWRMSFQIQERELIKGQRSLKPALKLLKKLRDTQNHKCISSYFLKTIFLLEVSKRHDQNFWNSDLSTIYMEMLKVYHSYLDKKTIPYYWNENHNMIGHLKDVSVENIANKIKNIIKKIEQNPGNPYIITEFLLDKNKQIIVDNTELKKLKQNNPPNPKETETISSKMLSLVLDDTDKSSNKPNGMVADECKIMEKMADIYEMQTKMIKMQEELLRKFEILNNSVMTIEQKLNITS